MHRAFVLLALAGMALQAADENSALPAVYKSASELMAALAKSSETRKDQSSAPISNEAHYRINIVKRTTPGVAMAHLSGPAKGTEVHYIIAGAATVVTGGTLIRPPAAATKGAPTKGAPTGHIDGGESRRVTKGDVIVIPAGTPHWYKA